MTDWEIPEPYYLAFAGLGMLWAATTIVAAAIGPWVNG